jgi:hypothetical protein
VQKAKSGKANLKMVRELILPINPSLQFDYAERSEALEIFAPCSCWAAARGRDR